MLSYILRCKKTMKVFLKRTCINAIIDDGDIYSQVGLFDFEITLQIKLIDLNSIEIQFPNTLIIEVYYERQNKIVLFITITHAKIH